MPNPYTGTDNDPYQEAQHRYLGKDWERFFGSLQGKRVNMAGFGQPGRAVGSLAMMQGSGSPTAETDASDLARTYMVDAYGDQQKREAQNLRAVTAGADIAETTATQAAADVRDREALGRAYEGAGTRPSPIVQQPGGGYVARPDAGAAPLSPEEARAQLLSKIPGALRPAYEKQFADQALAEQNTALATRKQAEVERENRAKDTAAAPFVPPVDAQGVPLTGEAVLKTLPASKQKLVTAVLEGRQQIPSGTALKDPYWKGVLETANLIDPNFDTVNYNARANTRKDFTSGAAAKQVNAINTVVGHLHDLATTGQELGNTGLGWVNQVYNAITPGGTKRGVALNNFETLKEGVATELMRTWRQVGAGSEKEIEDWKSTITSAKSPQELQGAFKTVGGMLESKLDALDNQYKQGMGTDRVSAITPESRKKLDALQGVKGGGSAASTPASGMIRARDPQGNIHEAKAGTALPPGWKLEGG